MKYCIESFIRRNRRNPRKSSEPIDTQRPALRKASLSIIAAGAKLGIQIPDTEEQMLLLKRIVLAKDHIKEARAEEELEAAKADLARCMYEFLNDGFVRQIKEKEPITPLSILGQLDDDILAQERASDRGGY